jgi:hypothetical protein
VLLRSLLCYCGFSHFETKKSAPPRHCVIYACKWSASRHTVLPLLIQPMSATTVILSNEAHLEGSLLQDGLREFHIPYATVPKRWRAAKLFTPQPGTLDCGKLR